jgi:hypothetical protein
MLWMPNFGIRPDPDISRFKLSSGAGCFTKITNRTTHVVARVVHVFLHENMTLFLHLQPRDK